MQKWKGFRDYAAWRDLAESQDVHNMDHAEALKWVMSALGIMDNPNMADKSQRDQINDALSSPLSAYPDKLEQLSKQLQVKNASNWPAIQAVVAAPERSTVSKLVSVISANAAPKRTITDQPYTEPQGEPDDNQYREPDGRSPL